MYRVGHKKVSVYGLKKKTDMKESLELLPYFNVIKMKEGLVNGLYNWMQFHACNRYSDIVPNNSVLKRHVRHHNKDIEWHEYRNIMKFQQILLRLDCQRTKRTQEEEIPVTKKLNKICKCLLA